MSARDTSADAHIEVLEVRLATAEAEIERLRTQVPIDQEQIAKEARKRFLRFIVDQVNPGHQERHHADLSSWGREIWQESARVGLIGFNAPVELGGEGRDVASWCLVLEELAKLIEDPGFLVLTQINLNWAKLIHSFGRADLTERYSKKLIQGDHFLAWAFWEPGGPGGVKPVAKKVHGGWSLTVHKPIIAGGMYATVFAVVAREETSDEPMLFLVEPADPGVAVAPVPTLGGRHQGFASLKLAGTFVPDDRLLVESDAVGVASPVFNLGVLNGAAVHLGWMQRLFGLCVNALRPKVRAGQALLDIPHVQAELGRLHMGIELSRSIFLRAIEKYRRGDADTMAEPLTPIFKHFLMERSLDAARTVITLQGAAGYMEEGPWGRYLTHEYGLLGAAGAQDLIPQQVGARLLMELEMRRMRKVGF
jgi:alkylation response protein AidB-like acyl-CoA dehydrogenase